MNDTIESRKVSPNTRVGNDTKKKFLTPCRRLGLARKSPASNENWHAMKVSPNVSSIKSNCDQLLSPTSSKVDNKPDATDKTPCRRVKIARQPFLKRLKSVHANETRCVSNIKEKELPNSSPPQPSIETDAEHSQDNKYSNENEKAVEKCSVVDTEPEVNQSEDPSELLQKMGIDPENITMDVINEIKSRIKQKEEKLKDLKLSQLYKKKHDLEALKKLSEQWREGCQAALNELLSVLQMQGRKVSLLEILQQLGIPPELVKYSPDLEDFE